MSLQIINGDCRKVLDTLPAKSVQCCVTSPPYWGLRDYGHADQIGQESTPADFVANMVEVFKSVWFALKDDGTLWLNLGDSYARNPGKGEKFRNGKDHRYTAQALQNPDKLCGPEIPEGLKEKDLCGIPWRVAFALQAAGWYLRSDIIWAKPNPMPESVTDRCTKAHEYIFMLTKSAKYYCNMEAIQEPSTCDRMRGPHSDSKVPGGGDNSGLSRRETEPFRNKRSVWEVATMSYAGSHFATFPPDLIKPCILAGTKPGDVVLDPFFGSGTVGEVSLEYGRSCIGIELNSDYVKLAEKRTHVTPGLAL